MKSALFIVGVLLVLATVLPFLKTGRWWIRALDFPRLQLAVAMTAVIAALGLLYDGDLRDLALLGALLCATAYQGSRILPYTPLVRPQVRRSGARDPASRLRLLIANVLMDNRQSDSFLKLVRASNPDMVLAVETDGWWDRELAALDEAYPHAVKHPRGNTYGMHLFSRLELGAPEIRFLVEDDIPSIRTAVRLRSGRWIDFHGVHPRPPRPAEDTEQRDAELLLVGRTVKAAGQPAVVAGDLNDVAWSHTTRLFQRLSGLVDPRVGRGLYATFHARLPFARWPLDHVFHDASFKLGELRRLGYFGSDHFPMLIELSHEPDVPAEQEAPSPDPGDRQEARDKIREGRAKEGEEGREP